MPASCPTTTFSEGVAAFKTAIEGVRSAITIVKDVSSIRGSTEQEQKAIDSALTVASTNTAIAEAALGQAFGYEMCKCTLPPTPMLTAGFCHLNLPHKDIGPIYECPKCGFNTAGGQPFTRTAPPRGSSAPSTAVDRRGHAVARQCVGNDVVQRNYPSIPAVREIAPQRIA